MSPEIVETPVEPLVLGDERTSSYVVVTEVGATRKEKLSTGYVNLTDDDEDDTEEGGDKGLFIEVAATASEYVGSSTPNPRIDTQNPLIMESDPVQSAAVEPRPDIGDEETAKELCTEKREGPEVMIESLHQQELRPEHEATVAPAATPAVLQDFLYHKINENQCNSHAKEILEFITSNFTDTQLTKIAPQVIAVLARQFQDEGESQEVSVDTQASLCLVEQMLLPVGRRSPFQGIYTAEEEEMLNQLAGSGSSTKNVLNQ